MKQVLEGVRVAEVAQWWFVPAAGAILADWGADVIKVEHPVSGDPQRGLVTSGLVPSTGGVNFMIEQPNRGKRSIGIDLAHERGRDLLYRLAETADVFLTNFLPAARVMQRAAFGDSIGAMTVAGGIAAALFRRERTGEPAVVDVSLLGTAMW